MDCNGFNIVCSQLYRNVCVCVCVCVCKAEGSHTLFSCTKWGGFTQNFDAVCKDVQKLYPLFIVVNERQTYPHDCSGTSGDMTKRRCYCSKQVTCIIHEDPHYQLHNWLIPSCLGTDIFKCVFSRSTTKQPKVNVYFTGNMFRLYSLPSSDLI